MLKGYWYHFLIDLLIIEKEQKIYAITPKDEYQYIEENTPLIQEAAKQLQEYFNKQRTSFTLPLAMEGSEFQLKVWNQLLKIPYGKTATYQNIAMAIGNKKASRAVGMANNKNRIMIVIPCHRVIGSNGSLTGYYGGLEMKQMLLDLEKQ
ncbi:MULTISPECIES: methylated-DNA--[protein]-cysteine S-methyltransferase [unclassified Thomasclavelia]|uniref:methylated-DNA--[protein]-cysteine S-methyltransferase n=1 Tax=unclassified Thomasclavelia TaxID=3025756 RepID=UPI000B383304|nr:MULTISPECIES: methylated-DNA--[protein]-cysteine S-methyltransferase [unclassified Thomasclavelia]OUP77814.1 hypothetical protein B5F09_04745 [Erysipelatoclostridium sp. An173]OUQ06327.1 hypothetical protein B5E92_11255 [Erysipelatoclostridium sp. An15]